MSIDLSITPAILPEFRPIVVEFDQCRRLDYGHGPITNVSWIARHIQSDLNRGEPDPKLKRLMLPAHDLAKYMCSAQVALHQLHPAKLTAYDLTNPVILVCETRTLPDDLSLAKCEVVFGEVNIVFALQNNTELPVILITRACAERWGMPRRARDLGRTSRAPRLTSAPHRLRSGQLTLPTGSSPGGAVISQRSMKGRAAGTGRQRHLSSYNLVLSSGGAVQAPALQMLRFRGISPAGLTDVFPDASHPSASKRGPSTATYQETCLLILFSKLLKFLCDEQFANEGLFFDDFRLLRDWKGTARLRELMHELLRLPVTTSVSEAFHRDKVADAFRNYARSARAAAENAGPAWKQPLSERLMLYGETLNQRTVGTKQKPEALRNHAVELLEWTLRGLFRAKHWRIGGKSIRRFDLKLQFNDADKADPIGHTSDVERLSHETLGSHRLQRLTDLTIEQLFILGMHARFNPFLIWHDMRGAVPLGHWAMAIADLDAGRTTHVTVWMAELYREQQRRRFKSCDGSSGPATMVLHWLHWILQDVDESFQTMSKICRLVVCGFPQRSGRLIEIADCEDGAKKLVSHSVSFHEDRALQATLFA